MKRVLSSFVSMLASILLLGQAFGQNPERHPIYEPEGNGAGKAVAAANLFLNAKVTASGFYGIDKPELAVDGKADDGKKYWGCENLPVSLQIDMGEEKELSSIKYWPYWQDGRIYKFKIEGSPEGKKWQMLVDQSSNSITGTADGFVYTFSPVKVRYVRTTILENSNGAANGGHIVEIQGFAEAVKSGLNAKAALLDTRFEKEGIPDSADMRDAIRETAWRGERMNGQVVLWADSAPLSQVRMTASPLVGPKGEKIPVETAFLRYTQAKGGLVAEILDTIPEVDIAAGTVRSAWITVNVPVNASPGLYKGVVVANAQGAPAIRIPVEINVVSATLPAPKDWKVHLDLWQHPEAVARWHDVPSWSPEHIALMKPLMKRLADAGQKVITCSIIDEAWGGQTYDWWPSMVEWVKGKDGVMRYDYTNFDKYVTMMMEVGIREQISCYTMLPWNLKVKYTDAASGDYKYLDLKPGDKSFDEIWGSFLTDFRKHLKARGWLDITCIGIDERADRAVKAAVGAIKKYAPEIKVASAVNSPSGMSDVVYDMSPIINHADGLISLLKERTVAGKKTTFYVCVHPAKPNTFTRSPLAEAEWLGLFAAANNLDGFLRWAYNSWNRDPFEKSDFGNWPPGDCWLVYPGNRSSVHFERLRDGIEDFEKINILRKMAESRQVSPAFRKAVEEMDSELKKLFTVPRSQGNEHADDVKKANELINKVVATK